MMLDEMMGQLQLLVTKELIIWSESAANSAELSS
jgi:hypothetical protein